MCVTEYIDGSLDEHPVCPVCSVILNIDLSAPALDVIDEGAFKRGSIINRIDMSTWRSSTKIEALVEELWKLRSRDSTIKVDFDSWMSSDDSRLCFRSLRVSWI